MLLCLPFLIAPPVDYVRFRAEGWDVRVERAVYEKTTEWEPVRREIEKQLYQVVRTVPQDALSSLRQVVIWVHHNDPMTKCMAYHPGMGYLKEHGMNPDMAKGVEVGNTSNFVRWTLDQPWMVLHELSHAYHDRFVSDGFENKRIKTAYLDAKSLGLYHRVKFWDGKERDGYAETNQMEYFAELSEAYFGCNDMFPFVRGELAALDPAGFAAIRDAWSGSGDKLGGV